jgi:pyruvate,water dikinase
MPYAFADLDSPQQIWAGGKGAALARLFQAGYPVPEGFVILSVEFDDDVLRPEALTELEAYLAKIRHVWPETAFAVRSSGLDEDSAQASFAGEFETVLGVRTDEEVCGAIQAVRLSRHSFRAAAYSEAQGLARDHEMAVVVQRLVRADYSGVLFTADPVTGDLMKMPGNFVRGLGEKLVSGEANPEAFTFDRPSGRYRGPRELRGFARRLYRLAERLDKELGTSQDIEWAVVGRDVYILQARPITSMREFNPATGEWNSSLLGDFLWSNGNAAEIQPEVMTLLTWSLVQSWGEGYFEWWSRYPASGCIGGRDYFNISIQVAPFARLPGGLKTAMRSVGDWWGRIPKGVTVPLAPYSRRAVLFSVLPMFFRATRRMLRYRKQIPGFVERTPGWCREMRARIRGIDDAATLAGLWRDELKPYYCLGTTMASAANTSAQVSLQAKLAELVGDADANALLSNLGGKDHLASLGPVVGLARVARGELGREAYLEQFGHRGPYEFELSRPQPIDDPDWLDRQLADFARQPFDADALLDRQRVAFHAAWQRFSARYPRKAKSMQGRLAEISRLSAQREAARSEVTRVMGVIRAFALRAGEMTGLGDDVFHLRIEELLAALQGDASTGRFLPARKATYARYCALPPYPPVISGRFDPFAWAADPNRRSDVFDAHVSLPAPTSSAITGFAGAAGVVEGLVRRIDHVEDGHLLQAGEILLTTTTNVGWTPLFPRAAAIVTDVGAPLSHAAIVARELGIPAVVGCNDATMRLRTGDRVRVNGGQGRVEILTTSEQPALAEVSANV